VRFILSSMLLRSVDLKLLCVCTLCIRGVSTTSKSFLASRAHSAAPMTSVAHQSSLTIHPPFTCRITMRPPLPLCYYYSAFHLYIILSLISATPVFAHRESLGHLLLQLSAHHISLFAIFLCVDLVLTAQFCGPSEVLMRTD
jgi:hypothetical protein